MLATSKILQHRLDQSMYLAGVGMATGVHFGVNQLAVYRYFKFAAAGGNDCDRFNLPFDAFVLHQSIKQAHGPGGVISNPAILDGYF